jgi:hypothetical protein
VGDPIDGIPVTLIDDLTGLPASVFAGDGITQFPATVFSGQDVTDAGGTVYPLQPGRYIFPLVPPGRYHLAIDMGEDSDYSFPSSVSDAALVDLNGGDINLAVGSRGEAFTLGMDPSAFDVPVDPKPGDLVISKHALTPRAGPGDFVPYEIEVFNNRSSQPFRNIKVITALPVGFRLDQASLKIDEEAGVSVSAEDGRTFTTDIEEIPPGSSTKITYIARIAAPRPGRATANAFAMAGTLQSNTAAATIEIIDELMTTKSHILGRVIRQKVDSPNSPGLANVAIYLETGTMVLTDQRGYFRFEGLNPGTHVVQLDLTTLPEGAEMVSPTNNNRYAAKPYVRMVDLSPGSMWQVEFVATIPEQAETVKITETPVEIPTDSSAFPARANRDWLDNQPVSFDWVFPPPDYAAPTPATKVLIQHSPAHTIQLTLDGQPVSPLNFDGTLKNSAGNLAVSLWSGINLNSGPQVLEAVRIDSFGNERDRQTRNLFFASPPVRLEFVPGQSTLGADGTTPPVIAVRLLDRDGHPASPDVTGRIDVAPPYAAWRPDTLRALQIVPGSAPETDRFVVGEDGVALIKLEPTITTGTAVLTFHLVTGPHEIRADLRGDRKDWIIVGLAEGSAGYDLVRSHLESGGDDNGIDIEDGNDGRIALFAKGRIKGGWLLTAAYDSAREVGFRPNALHNGIQPDAFYTVYGDESTRLENAPTSDQLYIKLEREAATALFGDFLLDWTATTLTTYNRNLHGLKVDYRGEAIRLSAFQSDAGLAFTRDEIRGDGLSGPYALSRRNIVPFSENIVLQHRDPIRQDIVLEEEQLSRLFDYSIDYRTGEVRLAEPLFATDREQRHQYLVVRYELDDDTAGTVMGGRAEYHKGETARVGASFLSEQHDGATSTLSGIDARLQLENGFSAEAEYAVSRKAGENSTAVSAEVAHRTETSDTRLYFRDTGANFGLGQLNGSQLGNRQIGVEGLQRIKEGLSFRELAFQEELPSTGDRRRSAEVQLEWQTNDWTMRSGFRGARDTRGDGSAQESMLVTAGLVRKLLNDRLELYADREQSLSGQAENLDYPERTRIGAAYKFNEETSIFTEHEWTEGDGRKSTDTRIGLDSEPWTGGHLASGMTRHQAFSPSTSVGASLNQRLRLSPKLEISAGFERGKVISGEADDESSQSPFHQQAGFSTLPQGNHTAIYTGVEWKPSEVLYLGRVETSQTDSGRRSGLLASAQSEPHADLGLITSLIAFQQSSETGSSSSNYDARFGAAWRPEGGDSILLNRLDLVRSTIGSEVASGPQWKVIENMHFNHQFDRAGQVSLHFGLKYALSTLDERDYESMTSFAGIEWRKNINPRWDVGLHAGALSSWQDGMHRTRLGLSVGRSFGSDIWVSTGYNFAGFSDDDFTGARQSESGMFVKFRLQFDEQSLAGLLRVIREE